MFKRKNYPLTAYLFVIIMCVTGCSVFAEEREEIHEQFSLKAGTPLSVQNINGSITISGWDNDYVDVLAVKKTKKGRDELDKVEVRMVQNGKLSIETEYLEKRSRVSVDYTIKVPDTVPVELAKSTNGSVKLNGTTGDTYAKSTNGRIEIREADGFIKAQTTNGNISVTETSGIKNVKTTNGSIDVSFSQFENDVDITTTNGSIDVRFPSDLDADIELKTTNGRIKANQIQILVDEISKKYVRGKLGNGGNKLNIKTTNGSISLEKM
ncbi:DUF4097 domain-containing protein [Candidatus Omnitrophota bacterium]